jgi:hypothetical protein
LGKYVEVCTDADGKSVYHYYETEFIPPNLIKNCVGNNTFKNTSGWTGAFYKAGKDEDEPIYASSIG